MKNPNFKNQKNLKGIYRYKRNWKKAKLFYRKDKPVLLVLKRFPLKLISLIKHQWKKKKYQFLIVTQHQAQIKKCLPQKKSINYHHVRLYLLGKTKTLSVLSLRLIKNIVSHYIAILTLKPTLKRTIIKYNFQLLKQRDVRINPKSHLNKIIITQWAEKIKLIVQV